MDINIHNPERGRVTILTTTGGKKFAIVDFNCKFGGTATMYFNSSEDLLNHAMAMKLLAEALEEEQAK